VLGPTAPAGRSARYAQVVALRAAFGVACSSDDLRLSLAQLVRPFACSLLVLSPTAAGARLIAMPPRRIDGVTTNKPGDFNAAVSEDIRGGAALF